MSRTKAGFSLIEKLNFFLEKGRPGYRRRRLAAAVVHTSITLVIVLALFFTGLLIHHTRQTIWTVAAILACLPFAKAAVSLIVRLPFATAKEDDVVAVRHMEDRLCIVYDLILTSRKKQIPVEIAVITPTHIYGFAPDKKVVLADDALYIKDELQNRTGRTYTVKLLDSRSAFLSRAEGLYNISAVDDPKKEIKDSQPVVRAKEALFSLSL